MESSEENGAYDFSGLPASASRSSCWLVKYFRIHPTRRTKMSPRRKLTPCAFAHASRSATLKGCGAHGSYDGPSAPAGVKWLSRSSSTPRPQIPCCAQSATISVNRSYAAEKNGRTVNAEFDDFWVNLRRVRHRIVANVQRVEGSAEIPLRHSQSTCDSVAKRTYYSKLRAPRRQSASSHPIGSQIAYSGEVMSYTAIYRAIMCNGRDSQYG